MIFGSIILALQGPSPDAIDQYVEAQMKAQHIPGLVLLVVKDGKTLKEQAYGVSNVEKKTPTKLSDRFDIGSIGKTMTAALVMQQVEQLKIKLDQPVRDILPDFPEKWKDITVRQLITHQSGLPDYAFVEGIGLNDTYDQQKWKDLMYKQELDFPSGRLYQYSNTNFVVLGLILEKVTGEKYADLLQKFILKPLGMNDTGFRIAGKGLPSGSATGYFYQDGNLIDAGPGGVSPTPSDGGEFMTLADLQKWSDAMTMGRVLRRATIRAMQTPARVASGRKTGYGFGWMTNTVEGSPQITHGGNSVGFSGTLSTFPKQHLQIYMLCNLYPVGGDGFALGLAKMLEPDLIRKPQPSATDPNPERTAKLQQALVALAKKDTKNPLFHEDMQLRCATARGQMVLPAYASLAGVEKMEFISEREETPDTFVRYRVNDGKASWIVDFQVTPEGTIYSIGKSPDTDKK